MPYARSRLRNTFYVGKKFVNQNSRPYKNCNGDQDSSDGCHYYPCSLKAHDHSFQRGFFQALFGYLFPPKPLKPFPICIGTVMR
uniref:Uncharacterized protein n=1 Tax=Anguilla anguilla TaxID=7936 RepID=A0A0E9VNJ0_ANGAN